MSVPSSRRDPLGIAGSVIADKYKIAHVVGEGGFSVVYLAEHTIWRQPVAIKCFKVLSNAPEEQRDRLLDGFIQEGKLMASLSSRSAAIVQARDVGTFTTPAGEWLPYMVLEWLDGKALDIVLYEEKRGGLPARPLHEALALLDPAAAALEIAHSLGIAHRDIKPANFFVMGDPRGLGAYVKVLDFGIAKVMSDHAAHAAAAAQTGKEITAFTPNYGAPEQFSRTHGATGPWTDVFAMALILVEILRGGRPALDGNDLIQMAVASRDPARRPTPRSFGVEVTDAVEHVFGIALAVSPGDRFRTMGQFWSALHQAVFPDSPAWNAGTSSGLGIARAPSIPTPTSAPRFTAPMSSSYPGGAPSYPGGMPSYPGGAGSYPGAAPSGMPSGIPMQLPSMVSAGLPVKQPSRLPMAFGAVALVALAAGGFGAFKIFTRPTANAPDAPVASASGPAPVLASAAPPASASAAPRLTECPEGTVLVPGGRFFMGSDDPGFKLWQPSHKVTLDTFCIDVYEVTAADYKTCSDVGECKRPAEVPDYPKSDSVTEEQHEKNKTIQAELCNFGKAGREQHPINCVSWTLADGYCKYKKRRLPTEAEWEYAARGSDGRKFPWGDEPGGLGHMNACGLECNKWENLHGLKPTVPRMYETDDGYPGTAPVGSFPQGKTKFGAYDFIGNVWEWTADWFETYKPDEVVNPTGSPRGDRKAIRGGGFNGGAQLWLNPAFRYHQLDTASAPGIGFRCAVSL